MYRYGGGERTKHVIVEGKSDPIFFEQIARGTNDFFW
jgi:hypothetical protein